MNDPHIIDLQKISDSRGNLSVIEEYDDVPFKIERAYWIYDVPGGESRVGHAYKDNEEFIVALSGSFDIITDDGRIVRKFHMDRSYYGLYIPKGVWREICNFSTNSLAMILASTKYNPADYISDYSIFKAISIR